MRERMRRVRTVGMRGAVGAALRRTTRGAVDFAVRVYHKAGDDDIFFLAGAIAFNVLIAAVPFLLLLVAIFGYVLPRVVPDPQQAAVDYVLQILPPSRAVVGTTRGIVDDVLEGRGRFGLLGLALFIWTSTRMIGTLRTVLRNVFELQQDRGIVGGKIYDAQMVLVAGTLFLANTGITVAVEAAQAFGADWLGLRAGEELRVAQSLLARLLAFAFIWAMFVLIYRYLPARWTRWRTALTAATFTAVAWELLKGIFAVYVSRAADYTSMYGTLATLVLLVFWIYYSALVFILGGEVAHVSELARIRREQREMLE